MSNDSIKDQNIYELLQSRLQNQAGDLQQRLSKLNTKRQELFGGVESKIIASDRIATENYCQARDMLTIGDTFLFGYNLQAGLRAGITLSDVFACFGMKNNRLIPLDLAVLNHEKFLTDFQNLYRYYKRATFSRFLRQNNFIYFIFQATEKQDDLKAFKWIDNGESLTYVDARSESEITYPPQYAFKWKNTTKDMHREGLHPHVSIEEKVYVETVGGDLTFKIEDNTGTGKGIYAEEVEYEEQTLNDAEVQYALLGGIIALRIKPYREKSRYFLFNEQTKVVRNIAEIEDAAITLPDQQGVLVVNGFFLRTGGHKIFQGAQFRHKKYIKTIMSPNGEDYLYVFYGERDGLYVLLQYNVMRQQVATPIFCNGFSLFDDGIMCIFKADVEPSKYHTIQIWQTPFSKVEQIPENAKNDFLFKIGNKTVVQAMAACYEILELTEKEDSYEGLYEELSMRCTNVLDKNHWISDKEAFQLHLGLTEIKKTAEQAISEYEKKRQIQQEEEKELRVLSEEVIKIDQDFRFAASGNIQQIVDILAQARQVKGKIIGLNDRKYLLPQHILDLENKAQSIIEKLSEKCANQLMEPEALDHYRQDIQEAEQKIESFKTATEGAALVQQLGTIATGLQLLIEVVSNLKIEDSTKTTQILDDISTVLATLNQKMARLRSKRKNLAGEEAVVELEAQLKLVDQSLLNQVELADTPNKCNQAMSRLLVMLEELESKFAEYDSFLLKIQDKREKVYTIFEEKRQFLIEQVNNRTTALAAAATRILKGMENRLSSFNNAVDINTFFAGDAMVAKVRDIINELKKLGDPGKSHELQTKLKATREQAVKSLLDKQELSVAGEGIRLGQFVFSVNDQPLALTVVRKDSSFYFHLVGTSFYEPFEHPETLQTFKPVFDQNLVSENSQVYRAAYLAYTASFHSTDDKQTFVENLLKSKLDEGYVKGIHDEDALKIWTTLEKMQADLGVLRFNPITRSAAIFAWQQLQSEAKHQLINWLNNLKSLKNIFGSLDENDRIFSRARQFIKAQLAPFPFIDQLKITEVIKYMIALQDMEAFPVSANAAQAFDTFKKLLEDKKQWNFLRQQLESLSFGEQYEIALDWVESFTDNYPNDQFLSPEIALLVCETHSIQILKDPMRLEVNVSGLHGDHPSIEKGTLHLSYFDFMRIMEDFSARLVPMYRAFQAYKKTQMKVFKESVRLEQFEPKPLASFVRNKLINEVYLPLIGSNMAKQIGVAGEQTRTDRMGLLLLLSPPGYGKTTLMEYVAQRLGMIFIKINGPSIGHGITSLDPNEAGNLAAQNELQKLNLALEMGDNVMLYLDDIQHCSSEFLQKFISLCDGQRKIEGVWKNTPKTYDLREKRFFVVMAGNPYTESGEIFKIPDMLANRADIYNLGKIIGEHRGSFVQSYVENAISSNPYLQIITARSVKDIQRFTEAAESNTLPKNLEGNYSPNELDDINKVLQKLITIREVILKVNQTYVSSAGMADAYRTEPPFKLQGSYRDMNKLAEKIVPIMNEQELQTLILSHYESESQTLTTGTESNLLKFKALLGWLNEQEAARWQDILNTFNKQKYMNGSADNPVNLIVSQLQQFNDNLVDMKSLFKN